MKYSSFSPVRTRCEIPSRSRWLCTQVTGPDSVTAIGGDRPPSDRLVPAGLGDPRPEQRVAVDAEMAGDRLQVVAELVPAGVFLGGEGGEPKTAEHDPVSAVGDPRPATAPGYSRTGRDTHGRTGRNGRSPIAAPPRSP